MVFSTPLFLCIFLPLALALFHLSPRPIRLLTLTLLSLLFYAWSDPRYILLLLWTCVVDYVAGCLLAGDVGKPLGPRGRRAVLILSLTNSIGLLVFFKYGAFLLASMFEPGRPPEVSSVWSIALPAGISFYTFESISYVVDLYRGHGPSAASLYRRQHVDRTLRGAAWLHIRGFIAFTCYIAQFPHLVAGPIIRFREIGEQLRRPRTGVRRFQRGTIRFCFGLAKKVLIADTLVPVVDQIFEFGGAHAGYVWIGAAAFALQIYFDFSGYSDMAIGMAQMLGFRFPENFDAPYRATSLTQFWRRWHMSLSRWLRDYIYVPLGGNRVGPRRLAFNLMITMLIAGVWHGSGVGFAIWGALHGLVLVVERRYFAGWIELQRYVFLRRLYLLMFLLVSWAIFRCGDGWEGLFYAAQMFNPFALAPNVVIAQAIWNEQFLTAMLVGGFIVFAMPTSRQLARRPGVLLSVGALLAFLLALITLLVRTSTPFIYFRF